MSDIIGVIPVDLKNRRGVDYKPGPEMIHTPCESCEIICWIGPNQLNMKATKPELPVLCMECLIIQCQKYKEEGEEVSLSTKQLEQ
jgi:hypothetical protein